MIEISHSGSGVPYHTTKEKCAMSGIFEGVVKCRKEKGRLAPARKCSIVYILYLWLRISWDVLCQLMVVVFDLIKKLHSAGVLLNSFFLVKLAHTKHLTTALFFISFLALARKGHQILDLKVYFFPRYHNEVRHFSQTGGSDAATRSDVENKWSVVCCLPITCQLRTI